MLQLVFNYKSSNYPSVLWRGDHVILATLGYDGRLGRLQLKVERVLEGRVVVDPDGGPLLHVLTRQLIQVRHRHVVLTRGHVVLVQLDAQDLWLVVWTTDVRLLLFFVVKINYHIIKENRGKHLKRNWMVLSRLYGILLFLLLLLR